MILLLAVTGCARWVFDTRTHGCTGEPVCVESSGPLRLLDQGADGACRIEATGRAAPRRYGGGCLEALPDLPNMFTVADAASARYVSLDEVDARWGGEEAEVEDNRGTLIELGSVGETGEPQVEIRGLGDSEGWLRWNQESDRPGLNLDCSDCAVVLRAVDSVSLTLRGSRSHAIVCSVPNADGTVPDLLIDAEDGLVELVNTEVAQVTTGTGVVVSHGPIDANGVDVLDGSAPEPRECSF